jgi:hypothetical protein
LGQGKAMSPIYVHGLGLWTPGYADVDSWFDGKSDESVTRPEAALLAGPHKRRASLLTRMAVEALGQAAAQAEADPATAASVWATVHGEIKIAVDLLGMMNEGEGKLSPTKFHNSVYNTASGYFTMACGNRAPATTLSGGSEIVAMALLEAAGMLAEGAGEVMLVLADEPYPEPFEYASPVAPLALALCLRSSPVGAVAEVGLPIRDGVPAYAPPVEFEPAYIAGALPLLDCIRAARTARVAIEIHEDKAGRVWCVNVAC